MVDTSVEDISITVEYQIDTEADLYRQAFVRPFEGGPVQLHDALVPSEARLMEWLQHDKPGRRRLKALNLQVDVYNLDYGNTAPVMEFRYKAADSPILDQRGITKGNDAPSLEQQEVVKFQVNPTGPNDIFDAVTDYFREHPEELLNPI